MNERIIELAKQARNHAESAMHLTGWDFDAEYDKKFAELIVKECAKVVNDTEYPYENESDKNTWNTCCVWSAEKLKEHFGVEE